MGKTIKNIKTNRTYIDCITVITINYIKWLCKFILFSVKLFISCIVITISFILGFLYGCLINIIEINCYKEYISDTDFGFRHGVNLI